MWPFIKKEKKSFSCTSSDFPCVFWRDQFQPFMVEVCLTCIWVSWYTPFFPPESLPLQDERNPYLWDFIAVQPGGWRQPGCLRTRGLRLVASGQTQTTCMTGHWWLWCRRDAPSLFCVLCNVHTPACLPGRRGEPTPTCPEMPPGFLYLPSLGYTRPSWSPPLLQFPLHSAYFLQ